MSARQEQLGRIEVVVRRCFLETFSRMMGVEMQAGAVEAVPPQSELTGVVGFSGDAAGYLALHVRREAVSLYCAALLGLEPDEGEEEDDELLEDTLGELTYLVMSRAQTLLLSEGMDLTLWLPSVVAGARVDVQGSSSRRQALACYEYKAAPVALQLVLLDSDEAAFAQSREEALPDRLGRSAWLLRGSADGLRPVRPELSRELVLEALADVRRVPALPQAALELQRELARGELARFARIQEIIEGDMAITAMALKVANSPYYRGALPCESVADAVVRLGLHETRRIALTACVLGKLGRLPGDEHVRTWARAVHVGSTCEALAAMMQTASPGLQGSAYLGGLLHEIGAVALHLLWPSACGRALVASREHGEPVAAIQRRRWGIDYAEVGGEVACRWNLPDSISEAIRHHRAPLVAPPEHRRLAQLVHLSAAICHLIEAGQELESEAGRILSGAWEALGLGPEDAHSAFARALEQRPVAEAIVAALAA